MQDIMPQLGAGAQLVRSYGPQGFRIGQDSHESHVLVLPTMTLAWGGALTMEALGPIFSYKGDAHSGVPLPSRERLGEGALEERASLSTPPIQPSPARGEGYIEILIIGTGKRHEMISPELRRALKEHGVGFDTMDTGAACRTFNILLGEGRRVAAALILPV